MPRTFLPLVFGAVLLFDSTLAMALGFGATRVQTSLGQRLDFAASLVLDVDETVSRDCVTAQVEAGDTRLPPRSVHAVLQAGPDPTRRVVRVTTDAAIDEPVVTIEVTVGCGSQLSRRFVVFVDPPGLRMAEADLGESGPLPRRVDPQSAALADIARQADAARRGRSADATRGEPRRSASRRPARPVSASVASSRPRSDVPPPVASSRPPRTRTALGPAPSPRGARLQLDRPALLAARPASPPSAPAVAAPLVAAAAPAASDPALRTALAAPPSAAPPAIAAIAAIAASAASVASDEAAAASERMRALETEIARARAESQAAQKTIAALQARLHKAEDERFSSGFVYALLVTTLLAALAAAALWWLRPRQRGRARWFEAHAGQQARADRAKSAPPTGRAADSSALPIPSESPPFWQQGPSAGPVSTRPAAIGGLEVTTVLGPEWRRPADTETGFAPGLAAAAGDALSMEELIDLEQQAEFFVVLGQDEAAIDLLERHTHSTGGDSPLPYLQLLEIHQRRGDQAAYDRIRQSFDDRFDASAPDWTTDLHLGRSLADYPQTVARLQSLWETPMSAMEALEGLLFRRHGSEETFDFPAYRELLFLYSVARDISANVETDFGSIDLFLPLDDPQRDSVFTDLGGPSGPVDLDVTNWPEDAAVADLSTAPRRMATAPPEPAG